MTHCCATVCARDGRAWRARAAGLRQAGPQGWQVQTRLAGPDKTGRPENRKGARVALELGAEKTGLRAGAGSYALPRPYIWFYSDTAHGLARLVALSDALLARDDASGVLITGPSAALATVPETPRRMLLPMSKAGAGLPVRFGLPAALMLATQSLPVALIRAVARRKVPVFVLETQAPSVPRAWALVPGMTRALMGQLTHVFLQAPEAQALWHAAGLPEARLTLCGKLSPMPAALGCNDTEREALSEALRHRTVWLAACLPEREEAAIIAAHSEALRESHRLVLILHPADAQRGPALKALMGAQFQTALRSEDDPITPETQVYVADTDGERGLWYRLAVACYMGGSLSGDGAGLNPLEPAALGCALVHGRLYGRYAEAFDLLRSARATRMIQEAGALGAAISTALRPEHAADQAHRGWQAISEGYEATEAVLAALHGALARGV